MSGSSDQRLPTDLVWLTEAEVVSLVSINDGIEALREVLSAEAEGQARNIDKALGTWPKGAMHALGSMMVERGYAGFKTWVHTDAGASAIFSLFDSKNGSLLAVLEAGALGQIRTAAMSGLGAESLAAPDADEIGLVGTGAQALTQIAAVAAARRIRRVKVFGRDVDRRRAFVGRLTREFSFDVIEAESVAEAVRDMPIVSLITRATDPFLAARMLAPGALVIAAGAILPANAEMFPDVLDRADPIVVDSIGNAHRGSRELITHFGTELEGWGKVQTLGARIAGGEPPPAGVDLVLFKPMGSGLSDLAIAIMAFERARDAGAGLPIRKPMRGAPTWRPVAPADA
jgi:ornithine cyclodeaminase/alanine dehydrogenase-like protein (mu-crystallin family)